MATDIVPELYSKIYSDYKKAISTNKKIKDFLNKAEQKKAKMQEVSLYAAELGECASMALCKNLTKENLPDGKLYWNIAERTIKVLLNEVYESVDQAAQAVQAVEDEEQGININSIVPDFPENRVNDLQEKLISILEEETDG